MIHDGTLSAAYPSPEMKPDSKCTTPHLDRAALITIDVQHDVLDGQPLEIAGSSAALPAMGELAQAFRDCERPIVHIVRLYRSDGSNVDLCRREAVMRGWQALAPGTHRAPPAAGPGPARPQRPRPQLPPGRASQRP